MPRLFAFSSRARVRGAVFGLTAALLLTGCQGAQPGGSPSESSTTASPTSAVLSPGPSATESSGSAVPAAVYKPADAKGKAQNVPVPVMPELAKENSKAGLEAFIRYWFQLLSYAYETGDVQKAKTLADDGCVLCVDLLTGVATNYTDGRWLVGGRYETPVIEVLWQESSSLQSAKVQLLQQEIVYMNPDGSSGREPTAAINDAAAFFGIFRNGVWSATDLGVIR
ncbi:DUF6318 family protein [Paenarthrobacter aromaticivorans]|uniref:DUF6318 family protein n=1 Tax=Paenarthrobacter aromaticivorans TaxID=2849150 RepID=UPI003A7F831B